MKYKPAITPGALHLLLTGPVIAGNLASVFKLDMTELVSIEHTVASTKPQSLIASDLGLKIHYKVLKMARNLGT